MACGVHVNCVAGRRPGTGSGCGLLAPGHRHKDHIVSVTYSVAHNIVASHVCTCTSTICSRCRPYSSTLGKAEGTEIFRNADNFDKVSVAGLVHNTSLLLSCGVTISVHVSHRSR